MGTLLFFPLSSCFTLTQHKDHGALRGCAMVTVLHWCDCGGVNLDSPSGGWCFLIWPERYLDILSTVWTLVDTPEMLSLSRVSKQPPDMNKSVYWQLVDLVGMILPRPLADLAEPKPVFSSHER